MSPHIIVNTLWENTYEVVKTEVSDYNALAPGDNTCSREVRLMSEECVNLSFKQDFSFSFTVRLLVVIWLKAEIALKQPFRQPPTSEHYKATYR